MVFYFARSNPMSLLNIWLKIWLIKNGSTHWEYLTNRERTRNSIKLLLSLFSVHVLFSHRDRKQKRYSIASISFSLISIIVYTLKSLWINQKSKTLISSSFIPWLPTYALSNWICSVWVFMIFKYSYGLMKFLHII